MATSGQKTEIALSKSKIVLMLLGALVFVAVGLWFVTDPPKIENTFWGDPVKIAIAGYASIIFFGLCAFFLIFKLSDKKPGLIIDDSGLLDNSSALSAGQVLWTDIENISLIEIHGQKLIMLKVKNPQFYIGRQKNLLKRKAMDLNYKMYGTPISITSNGLKTSFDSLLTILTNQLQASQKNK